MEYAEPPVPLFAYDTHLQGNPSSATGAMDRVVVPATLATSVAVATTLYVTPIQHEEKSSSLAVRARRLMDRWQRETGIISALPDRFRHPAYQELIEMGKPAIPHILSRLEDSPDFWFQALLQITGEKPYAEEDERDFTAMRDAWLEWGRREQYL